MRRFVALSDLYGACLSNAEALSSEANLLFVHGHFARAYALAYTGWEEIGKAQITGDFAYDMVAEEEFEAAYVDHKIKSAYNWRRFDLNVVDTQDSTIEYDRGKATKYFETRQTALYVNKTPDLKALSPGDAISKAVAETAISALSKELQEIRTCDAMNERMGSKSFLK